MKFIHRLVCFIAGHRLRRLDSGIWACKSCGRIHNWLDGNWSDHL